jgi:hypothetical protein
VRDRGAMHLLQSCRPVAHRVRSYRQAKKRRDCRGVFHDILGPGYYPCLRKYSHASNANISAGARLATNGGTP